MWNSVGGGKKNLEMIFLSLQMVMEIVVFWVLTVHSYVVGYHHIRGPYCFHLLHNKANKKQTQEIKTKKDGTHL
jgi:hypothetical protein